MNPFSESSDEFWMLAATKRIIGGLGYLLAFGINAALRKTITEGGSWEVCVSLAVSGRLLFTTTDVPASQAVSYNALCSYRRPSTRPRSPSSSFATPPSLPPLDVVGYYSLSLVLSFP
ncbi:uncharacterized protein EV420DRAFT_1641297 [Desarmillaria tabescens]|uniref:Uncharacterized protein n=1 Tax=Armillaria tabescens TaxID=1929756 RepID=A0AA39KEZ4_ARMTA|nr:uncharacterized protein EV420DRAFT_1641297 [Desarmillaria tabescens]KAK0459944.1 hypothetical protein EV420DRAFT_1641297 [Desarmillaria tabescens]